MNGIWWQLGLSAVVLVAAVLVLARVSSSDVAIRMRDGIDRFRQRGIASEGFDPRQQRIVEGVSEVAERSVSDVLRPRPDVVTVDVTARCAEARDVLVTSGHSRAPVVAGGSLDDVVGIVHLRDLVAPAEPCTAGDQATAATIFPETLGALDALRQLQRAHVQMAVVINEHGGAEGIVTVADLVHELVGEIFDGTDGDVPMVQRDPDGSVLVPGRFPVHDLPDLGIEVPEGQYATLAGYLLWRLQRIPDTPGDTVEADGWRLTVTQVEDRAITGVRLTRLERAPAEGATGPGEGVGPDDDGVRARTDQTANR